MKAAVIWKCYIAEAATGQVLCELDSIGPLPLEPEDLRPAEREKQRRRLGDAILTPTTMAPRLHELLGQPLDLALFMSGSDSTSEFRFTGVFIEPRDAFGRPLDGLGLLIESAVVETSRPADASPNPEQVSRLFPDRSKSAPDKPA